MTTPKLDEVLPLRTAGALPSSRTEDMLAEALASDDIEHVKAQLQHVWGHYQSLEFALVEAAANTTGIRDGILEYGLQDEDPVDIVARIIALPVLEQAYNAAHRSLDGVAIGMTVPDTLRLIYSDLDHSDPARELSDADIQRFFETLDEEDDK